MRNRHLKHYTEIFAEPRLYRKQIPISSSSMALDYKCHEPKPNLSQDHFTKFDLTEQSVRDRLPLVFLINANRHSFNWRLAFRQDIMDTKVRSTFTVMFQTRGVVFVVGNRIAC